MAKKSEKDIISLDLSTNTGWALFKEGLLTDYGVVTTDTPPITEPDETYPASWVMMALDLAYKIADILEQHDPCTVIIEETNKSSRFTSRYSQKCLEYCHAFLNYVLMTQYPEMNICYVNTSAWRKAVDLPGVKKTPEYLQVTGHSKTDYKWQAVVLTNILYNTEFKKKDNDICDAILMGRAWLDNKV